MRETLTFFFRDGQRNDEQLKNVRALCIFIIDCHVSLASWTVVLRRRLLRHCLVCL